MVVIANASVLSDCGDVIRGVAIRFDKIRLVSWSSRNLEKRRRSIWPSMIPSLAQGLSSYRKRARVNQIYTETERRLLAQCGDRQPRCRCAEPRYHATYVNNGI